MKTDDFGKAENSRRTRDVSALAKKAAEAVDADRVVELTREFVRIRSVYEPGIGGANEEAFANHIAGLLSEMGLEVRVEEAAPGRPNVIADWKGSAFGPGAKTLMLEGHTDVVTEGDPDLWTHPPFDAALVDGRIYGRGSADMKAGNAAAICALAAVMQVAPDLPGRIRVGIVADEEGQMIGIKHFIEQGWASDVDGALICEPLENKVCLSQKGALRIAVHFIGAMSHGAMPYTGKNPIPWMADFIQAARQLEASEQKRLGPDEFLGLPWITPTIVSAPARGEPQINVVPGNAYLTLDIRTTPGQDHEHLKTELQAIVSRIKSEYEGSRIELEVVEDKPVTLTPGDDPLVQAVETSIRETWFEEPSYGGVPGATDGTFLHAWADVPIVTIGPGITTLSHKTDEYIDTDDIVKAARLYAATAVHYLS